MSVDPRPVLSTPAERGEHSAALLSAHTCLAEGPNNTRPMAPKAQLRVMHTFGTYLNNTENWIYRLLLHTPDVTPLIVTRYFQRCNFHSTSFEYLEFPVREIQDCPQGIPFRLFNRLARWSYGLYPWYIARTSGSVDLLHSHFADVGWHFRPLAKRLGIPHVVSFYGYDYKYLPHTEPVWRERYRRLFREADLFLCEGENGASLLAEIGCPSEKIQIARLGVAAASVPFFHRRKAAGQLRLLQVASYREKKGHLYTLLAFASALEECPNMTLTLVGHDSEGRLDELKALIRGRPAESRVQFLGSVDFDRLHEFMKDYDVFIHPSCHTDALDCEGGAPIVLLDAQATGMPAIATAHCDIPSEVLHGVTGLLAPERDVDCLADAIRQFYWMDGPEYMAFCDAARAHIEAHHDVVGCGLRLREIYDQLLAGTRC